MARRRPNVNLIESPTASDVRENMIQQIFQSNDAVQEPEEHEDSIPTFISMADEKEKNFRGR